MTANVKCVTIGDGAVGKTCLLIRYAKNEFPQNVVPTVFDQYTAELTVGNKAVKLNLCDTAGQEDYSQLRQFAYEQVSVFIVCFSAVQIASYENVKAIWVPELRRKCPDAPIILVCNKIDLRDDEATLAKLEQQHRVPITKMAGQKLANEIGAVAYFESSAKTGENVQAVFQEVISVGMAGPKVSLWQQIKKIFCN